MAVNTNNLNEVIEKMAKMEKAVELEVIREARKRFRAIMRQLVPGAKSISPVRTGELKKSVKVKGRSRRGVSTVKVEWTTDYANILNFKPNQSAEGYATDHWKSIKEPTDEKGTIIVKQVFKEVLEKHGVKVENK
jgi:hypothetical protein